MAATLILAPPAGARPPPAGGFVELRPSRVPRAPGRVVLGIEVEDDGLAAEVRDADALAGIGRRGEVGCRLAFGDHGASVVGARPARRERNATGRPRRGGRRRRETTLCGTPVEASPELRVFPTFNS